MRREVLTAGVLAAGLLLLVATPVRAFPQWQLSTGAARCNQCHFAPAGGGLLTGYGQDSAGEELATFGGNGAFLHGAGTLPRWLGLGGDFRGAFVAEDVQDPAGTKVAAFPMQAQLAVRATLGDFSVYGSVGYRGQIRANEDVVPEQNYQPIATSHFISPEHYVMWRPSPVGPYVRAGRFFAPFGLRMAEHVVYVRSDLGFDTMQETYNLSGGYVTDDYELHLTAFVPDFLRHMGSVESGVTGYLERRIGGELGSIAVQGRYASSAGMTRAIVGGVGKIWIAPARMMVFAEADLQHRELGAAGGSNGFVGTGGLALLPTRGVLVTLLGERAQTDLDVARSSTNGVGALLSWFPYAHAEVQLLGLLQYPAGMPVAKTFLAQLHYFL